MRALAFDLRDALRGLRRDLAYAATVVVTLALTIGAATAAFSIVNGVLLKPLAFRESHKLVALHEVWKQFSDKYPYLEVNERHFEYWRSHAQSFESMAQYIRMPANISSGGEATQISLVHTSGSLFDVLKVEPALGRLLTPADEPSAARDVVVITDRLWRERFGADRAIVGRTVALDGKPYTIVGVAPAGFRLPRTGDLTDAIDAFVTIRMDAEEIGWAGDHNNLAVGRLKEGATPEQAQAELDVLQRQVSVRATQDAHEPVTLASSVKPLVETIIGYARRGLLLLFGAILSVLLIACSNLANLSLTRTLARLRESAVRLALGASRERLIVKAVLEQLVLAIIGGAAGIWIAWGALAAFVRTAPLELPRVNEVALDGRVLAFAAVVSLGAGLLVAILPAWRVSRRDVQIGLRASGIATTSDRGGMRTRTALLALQVALSVALLVVTGLFGASLIRLLHVDKGFTADRVLAVPVAFPATRYADKPVQIAGYDRLLESIHALPGVQAATTTSMLPLAGQGQVNFIAPEGSTRPRSENPTANFRMIAPEYFRTLGVTILRGRTFDDSERAADQPVPALISQPIAEKFWPGQDSLGKHFSRQQPGERSFVVVGVVADAHTTSLERRPPLMVYVPYWWQVRASTSLLIKTAADPTAIMPTVRRAIAQIDPEIAIGRTRTLDAIVETSTGGRKYQVQLFSTFGAVALFIATLGVYAVTSYGVSRRRREMNIRVALGARPSEAVALLVRQGAVSIGAGLLAGTVAALLVGRLIASLLFEVGARDPAVIASVVATVGIIGIGACVVAASRGLRVDPAAALREE